MGAIEFAKNIQTTGKIIFSGKHGKHMVSFFVSFLQVLCLSTPREVSASSTKIKHTTRKQTTHTHTYKNNKNNIARRHQQTDQGRMMRSPCQKQCLTFQLYKSREDSGNQERKQSS